MKTGKELRDEGISRVSMGREEWISHARDTAVAVAKGSGKVTINDLRTLLDMPEGFSPNTWGAILRGDQFQPIGYTQATHPSAHARVVRVYTLKGGQHA